MYHTLRVGEQDLTPIDWEMCPELTFGTFESWGGRERVRNNSERLYYFFIDNWEEVPKLFLMERGVKHARVMAEIRAPEKMVADCVAEQGWAARFEQTFGINDEIRHWLKVNVFNEDNRDLVVPLTEDEEVEDMGPPLPTLDEATVPKETVQLPAEPCFLQEEDVTSCIMRWNFYDREQNPEGSFDNSFAAGADEQTVVDLKTGLMWQSGGLDINSIRKIRREIHAINEEGFAGYKDWRLPTMEEALSLMEPRRNAKGVYLRRCFSWMQPFIFVAAQRKPGGFWFVDYKQGRAFWSSGTIPGGFARLVRAVS